MAQASDPALANSPCSNTQATDCAACDMNSGTASPEIAAGLPRQIRVRAWERPIADRTSEQAAITPILKIHRRWDRLVRLFGDAAVLRLLNTHVTIFGLGGVGSYAAEALARSAIGQLTLVDFDDVCLTNINRQLQAFPNTVGQSKAALLAARVQAIHPESTVTPLQAFYDEHTSDALLNPAPSIVIDAIDNVTSKVLLLETCVRRSIPVISITGAGARLDPTQIRIADLSRTKVDPLARILRKELSRRGIGDSCDSGIPVVYSEEDIRPPIPPAWDAEQGFQCICPHNEDSPHACERRRQIYGTAAFMTAAFAMAAVSWCVRRVAEAAEGG